MSNAVRHYISDGKRRDMIGSDCWWSKCVGRVSESPLLVISVVFGVADCRVLKRSYFADFGRIFDGSTVVLLPMLSQGARDR